MVKGVHNLSKNRLHLNVEPFFTEKLYQYIFEMDQWSAINLSFYIDNTAVSRIKLNKSSLCPDADNGSFYNKVHNISRDFKVIHLNKINILNEDYYHQGIMTSMVSFLFLKLLTCTEFIDIDFEVQLVNISDLSKLSEPYGIYNKFKNNVYSRVLRKNQGNLYYQPLLKENRLEDIKYYTELFLEKGNIIYERMPKDFFEKYKNKTAKLEEIERNFLNLETYFFQVKEQSLKVKLRLMVRKSYLNTVSQIFPNKKAITFGNKTFFKIKTINDGRKFISEVLLTYLRNNYEYESNYSMFDEDDYRYDINIFRGDFYKGYYGYDEFRINIGSDRLIGKFICCDTTNLKPKKIAFR